jgi:hypothetical protein
VIVGAIALAIVLRIAIEIRRVAVGGADEASAYLLVGAGVIAALCGGFSLAMWLYSRPALRLMAALDRPGDQLVILASSAVATRQALSELIELASSPTKEPFVALVVSPWGIRVWAGRTPRLVVELPADAIRGITSGQLVERGFAAPALEIETQAADGRSVTVPFAVVVRRFGAVWSATRGQLVQLEKEILATLRS